MSNDSTPAWKDVVSKEVDDCLLVISADIGIMQKSVEEAKDKMAEDVDKMSRRNNVILYNVIESTATQSSERAKEDKKFCQGLMVDVLKTGFEEGDIKKLIRLGKVADSGNLVHF